MSVSETSVANATFTPARSARKGIPLDRIIELRQKDLSYQEIANVLGCTKTNVFQRLEPFDESITGLPHYRDSRQDIWDVIEQELVFSFTPAEVKKASFRDRSVLFGILRDKQMESNKHFSTQNIFNIVVQQSVQMTAQKVGKLQDDATPDVDNIDK